MNIEAPFLIYGLQRTGTNYVEQLMKRNLRVLSENNLHDRSSILHKHFRLYDEKLKVPHPNCVNSIYLRDFRDFRALTKTDFRFCLIVSRHPPSWLQSYAKWGKKWEWPPSSHHYIEEYNLFYRKWLDFANQSSLVRLVKYEDVVRHPLLFLRDMRDQYLLRRRVFSVCCGWRVPSKVPQSRRYRRSELKHVAVGSHLWDLFEDREKSIIKSKIDHRTMHQLGYELT